jgi:hypothetical protein
MGQFNPRLQPKFRFSTFTVHMNVHGCFLAGEEIEAERSCSKNCRAQAMFSIEEDEKRPFNGAERPLSNRAVYSLSWAWRDFA